MLDFDPVWIKGGFPDDVAPCILWAPCRDAQSLRVFVHFENTQH